MAAKKQEKKLGGGGAGNYIYIEEDCGPQITQNKYTRFKKNL